MSAAAAPPPRVSIALATYEGARHLEPLLDSLLAQDLPGLEIVVGDDASTDATPDILARYAAAHPLTLLPSDRNLGFVRNFERVLVACTGTWIALADQDDVWAPDKLSSLVARAEAEDALMVFSDATLIDADGALLAPSLWRALDVRPEGATEPQALRLRNRVTGCTCLIHRRLLEPALPIPDGFPYHDWWLAFVAARLGHLVAHPAALVQYRQHGRNVIGVGRRPRRSLGERLRGKWTRLGRIERAAAETELCQRAFLALEARVGLDTELGRRLVDWSVDRRRRWSLAAHRGLFADHPELFALERAPEPRRAAALAPVRRQKAVAMVELLASLGLLAALLAAGVAGLAFALARLVGGAGG